jgi:hypothetical protein
MPFYTFQDINTSEEVTLSMRIAELDEFKAANPHLRQLLSAVPLADPTRVGVTTKPQSGFRDLLKEIKGKHRGNTIETY